MMMLSVEEVLSKLQQLPSLPAVLAELLASFDRENISVPQLVDKIGMDQGLSARILRVANSPFYGFSSRIGSIKEAVVVLGFNGVRSLAIAAEVIDSFNGLDCRAFWQHSIGAAFSARVIARKAGLDEETAFTAGLMHDIGKLVLEIYFEENFRRALSLCRKAGCELVNAEKSTMGTDHGLVGFEVARRWKFPLAMQLAIRNHHEPDGDWLTDIVHVANVVSHALEIGNSGYDFVPRLSHPAWERLGLDFRILKACFGEIERLSASSSLFLGRDNT